MSDQIDALDFALSKLDGPHQHHRHCIHNTPIEEQWERWRINIGDRKATDEEMELLGFRKSDLRQITPDDWEIDVPDLDFSRFDGSVSRETPQ